MDQLTNPQIWAQHGGITGLVILALFVILAIFLKAQSTIYKMHRSDMLELLDFHAKEREGWWRIIDIRQQETNAAIAGITSALNKIAMRRLREDEI